jgi:isocitrate dehydrogenase kinase/phosphatase
MTGRQRMTKWKPYKRFVKQHSQFEKILSTLLDNPNQAQRHADAGRYDSASKGLFTEFSNCHSLNNIYHKVLHKIVHSFRLSSRYRNRRRDVQY